MAMPVVTATGAIAFNLDADGGVGAVIGDYAKNINVQRIQASVTKLMTFRLARKIWNTPLLLQTVLTFTAPDIAGSGTGIFAAGDTITVEHAFYALFVVSDNAVAALLGRVIGDILGGAGGIARFVQEMNAEAVILGMTNTVYADASGLSVSNLSTPRDICRLYAVLRSDDLLLEIDLMETFEIMFTRGTPQVSVGTSTNLMIGDAYIIGGKSGSLVGIVFNMTILVEMPNGQYACLVVLNATDANTRFQDLRDMMAALLAEFVATLGTPAEPFTPAYPLVSLSWDGDWWPPDPTLMFQDLAGTVAVAAGNPVRRHNGIVNGLQLIATADANRPVYQDGGNPRLTGNGTTQFLTLNSQTLGASHWFASATDKYTNFIRHQTSDTQATYLAKAGATANLRTFQWLSDVGVPIGYYHRGILTTSTIATMNDGAVHNVIAEWDGVRGSHVVDARGIRIFAAVNIGTAIEEAQNITSFARTESAPAGLDTGARYHTVMYDNMTRDISRRLRDWGQNKPLNAFADPTGGQGGGGDTPIRARNLVISHKFFPRIPWKTPRYPN